MSAPWTDETKPRAGIRLRLRNQAALGLVAVAAGVIAVLYALPFRGPEGPAAAGAVLAAVAFAVLLRIEVGHPYGRLGAANGITLFRTGGAAVFAAFAIDPAPLAAGSSDDGAWWIFAAALGLLALDGLDGWAARRQGLASGFGARFDMEVDALLILAMSVIALGLGKAGAWVVAIGALRYAFVAAGWLEPRLVEPLPPSQRRKVVCVVQVVVLAALLSPAIRPPASEGVAAAALALLVWSFAVDIRWLRRERPS